jgi:hypothetical protein
MKLKIEFDEIKDAIEQASYEHHFLIDKKNHKIVFISEVEDDYEKKLEEVENDNFIDIEPRMPEDDFRIMEYFVYEIQEEDLELAEKFHEVLEQRKPFRNFKELINQHPKLRERWFLCRDKELANEAMNWICDNDIELEDKSFMPKIEIKELNSNEVILPQGFKDFCPAACMKCNNKEGFKTRYFELNYPSENMLIEKEIKRIMKGDYWIKDYGHIGGGEKEILTSSECQKCKSKDIFV